MIKHITDNRHVEIFPKLEKVILYFFESKFFLGSGSDPSKLPRVTTARSRSVLEAKNSLKFRIQIIAKPTPSGAYKELHVSIDYFCE